MINAEPTALLIEIRAYIIHLLAIYGMSRDWQGVTTTELVRWLDLAITHNERDI